MNVKACCINECKSSSIREQDRGVTFHRLVREGPLRQAWITQGRLQQKIKQLEEDSSNINKLSSYICSRHFRKVDFELKIDKTSKFVLKSVAIPTIFPWGITQMEDLPKLYSEAFFSRMTEEPKNVGNFKTDAVKLGSSESSLVSQQKWQSPEAVSPHHSKDRTLGIMNVSGVAESIKGDYFSSADTESDKDGCEGNLVIDETVHSHMEPAKRKKKKRTSGKLTFYRKGRKPRLPSFNSSLANIQEHKMGKVVRKSLEELTDDLQKNIDSKTPQETRSRSPRIKKNPKAPSLDSSMPSSPAQPQSKDKGSVGPTKSLSLEDSAKLSSSPMLRALIEKASPSKENTELFVSHIDSKTPNYEKVYMVPGTVVEAKDFSEQWYPAKIVEVDYDEKEVLIHYDNWSQRYDEWISMASSRLRVVAPPSKSPRAPQIPTVYNIGERCLARWSDNRRFPATVQTVLPDDKYEVLFDDGFVRVMKWQLLAKGQASHQASTRFSPLPYGSRSTAPPPLPAAPSEPPPPPPHTHLFDPHRDHLGSKEERRDKKRKLNVKELFSSNQGKRKQSQQARRQRERRGIMKHLMRIGKPLQHKVQSKSATVIQKNVPSTIQKCSPFINTTLKSDPPSPKITQADVIPELVIKKEPTFTEQLSIDIDNTVGRKKREDVNNEPSTKQSEQILPSREKQQTKERVMSTLKQQLLMKQQTSNEASNLKPHPAASMSSAPVDSDLIHQIKREDMSASPPLSLKMQPEDLARLLKEEWSCKWIDNQPVGEITVIPPRDGRSTQGDGEEGERLERISVKVEDYRLPPNWTKLLTRRCVGTSAGKWDVVLVCPQGRRYRSKAEISARFLEPDGPSLLPYQKCLQDYSIHRKLARRLGWDTTSAGAPLPPPSFNETLRKKLSSSPAASKLETLVKSGTPPTRTTPKLKVTPESVIKAKVTTSGSTASKSRQSQNNSSSSHKQRTSTGTSSHKPKTCGLGSPKTTLGSATAKPKIPSTSGSLTQFPAEETLPACISTTPQSLDQPPVEEGFIQVGTVKVQIIGTLLRCPKDGCFKNFRKDNLLQMHIKHYHPEMISLLGNTPNVADLAYARTVVEDLSPPPKPIERPHRVRERRSTTFASLTTKPDPDGVGVKKEYSADLKLDTTPKKDSSRRDSMEHSPKLRNLLLEPKLDSPSKFQHDVEDMLQTFKIKQESEKLRSSNGSSRSRHGKVSKPDKELTKSQVMALINKIAEEEGRSPSQSPISKHDDKCEDVHSSEHVSKSKKKKRGYDDYDADFELHSSKRQRRSGSKSSSYLDIWNEYVAANEDTQWSTGTPAEATTGGESCALKKDLIQTEIKQEDNQYQMYTEDNGEKIKIVHMKREEIINCYCGFGEEDGLMIQCELCLCWQHAVCHGIEKESQVPDKYVCHICLYPNRGRKSQRHLNNQDWLYEGRLPRLEHQINAADPNILNGLAPLAAPDQNRAQALKKSHQLCGNLLHVSKILHSLRCKIDVSTKKDHPKLYLWSKSWDEKTEIDNMDPNVSQKSAEIDHSNEQPDQQLVSDGHSADTVGTSEMGDDGGFLDKRTEEMIDSNIGPYGDIDIDEVKLAIQVGESIEVSEVNEMGDDVMEKCDNVMELAGNGVHNMDQGGLLSSPGGTPIHLPISSIELKSLVKSVEVCAPQPEAAIEPSECRQRLLQHIENLQMLVDARLDSIEAQIAELESQDPSLADDETPESYPRTKQTLQMLIRDLHTVEELGAVTS